MHFFTFNRSFACLNLKYLKLSLERSVTAVALVVANKTWTKRVAFMGNKLRHVSVTQIRTPWKYSTVVRNGFSTAFQGVIPQ